MFITLRDSIINIEEIRHVSTSSGSSHLIRIYFKNPSSPSDYFTFHYGNKEDLKNDFKALVEACEEYNKTKIKN
jgi:hypothetical protein